MSESFAGLRELLIKVDATVLRCRTQERLQLTPDFANDFQGFSDLLEWAVQIFSAEGIATDQFHAICMQMYQSLSVARFIFERKEVLHQSLSSTLLKVHGDIVRHHLQTLSLFIELQIYSKDGAAESTWERICF